MQSKNNIPWNVTPRNGINTFFTEESYAKWFGRESHESRLAANLQKVGIILPPLENRKHAVENLPTIHNKDSEGKPDNHNNAKSAKDSTISRDETIQPGAQKHLKPKPCTATAPDTASQNFKSEVQSTSHDHKPKTHPTPHSHKNTDDAEVKDQKPIIYTVTNASGKDEEVKQVASHENASRAEDYPKPAEEATQPAPKTKVPEEIAVSSRQIDSNAPRPDRQEEPTKPVPQTKVLEETGGACKLPTQPVNRTKVLDETSVTCKPSRQLDGNAPRPDLPTTLSTDAERPASKEEIKKIMKENIFYFNYKDRTDKYNPKICWKKPTKRRSNLTAQDQRSFFNLHKIYSNGLPLHPNPDEQERIREYKRLLPRVKKEQGAYQKYLKFAASQCEDDYRYIHPDANKYITAKLHGKARRVWSYPRYYRPVMKFDLPDKIPDNTPTLQYVRPLLEMGHVARLVLPSIIPGCPQPCTPTSYSEISSVCPPIPDKATGPLVWDHEECSRDVNMEQLAVPNKCNVALSASALKYLVDHQGHHRKFWDMPITVREYNLKEGDSHVLHRVIYIDKPLIKTSEFSMRDKQVMFQKYALKTAAQRPNQKMVVYSRIKPAATVTKADPETVVKEIASWESKVKATSAISDDSTDESADSDDGPSSPRQRGKKSKSKRDRKREKKAKWMEDCEPAVKDVGMFDIEKDIDDLETFGMDSPPKIKPSKSKADDAESKGKGRRRTSLENEFDLLQQVKLLAKKDVAKVPEVLKGGQKTTGEKHAEDPRSKASHAMVRQGNDSNVQNSEIAARNKDLETTQAQEEIPTDVSDEKTTKSKPRKLSAENVSSFSAIMKRMSTVKAKLMERDGKPPSDEHSVKPGGKSTAPASHKAHTSAAYSVRTRSTESQEMETQMDTDSDSDAEKDDLVIDMPERTESPAATTGKSTQKAAGAKKSETVEAESVHETIESPPASPPMDLETPQSPVFEQPQSPDTASDSLDTAVAAPCVMIPLDNEEVVRDYSAVKFEHIVDRSEPVPQTTTICHQTDMAVKVEAQDNIKEDKVIAGSEQESPARTTRGAKRRSSDIKPEATRPKRCLRTGSMKEEIESSATNSKDEANMDEQSPLPARGRGRKRELATERLTRSRSVSMESPSTSPATGSRRVTRHSLDSAKHSQDTAQPSMEPPSEPDVPVKKRRGRPPKKQVTEEPQNIDTDSDKPQTTSTADAGKDASAEDLHGASIDSSIHEASDEDKPVSRRRGRPPKASVNDACTDDVNKASKDSSKDEESDEDKPVPRRRGRPPKATVSDACAEDLNKVSIDSAKDEGFDEEKPVLRRRGRPPKVTVKDAHADLEDEESDEDKPVPRRRGLPLKATVSEACAEDRSKNDSSDEEKSVPRRRGRPPKKNSQDQIEAKKVHEMAQAMKKKIAASMEEKAKCATAAKADTDVRTMPIVQGKSTAASKVDFSAKTQPTAQGISTATYKADTRAKGQPTSQGKSDSQKSSDTKAPTNVDTKSADSKEGQFKLNFYTRAEPEAQEAQRFTKEKPSKGQVGSGQTGQGKEAGLDSILTMQKEMLKPEADLKGLSTHEQFARQHGMGRVVFPVEGNVTYHQWKLADTQVLIRCSYHGHSNPQGIVHLVPKIEYQPIYGFERETPNDTCRNWISVYVRPNSTLVRTRINPYNSEVMMSENINFSDLIPQGSFFKSLKAFSHLDTIFEQLKSLKAGQYLLRNNPLIDKLRILEAAEEGFNLKAGQYLLRNNPLIDKLRILEAAEEGFNTFDLHKQHASFTKCREIWPVQWMPIDLRLLLPHHKRGQLVPCLYTAKDMAPGAEYPKKKAKKKRKNKPELTE